MRTFDYRHLPRNLFEGKVGEASARLYEDRGKLELLKGLHPAELDALRGQAHFDNVNASTRIEGLYVDPERVRDLVEGRAEPLGETEAQIIGYSNALRLVEGEGAGGGAGGSEVADADAGVPASDANGGAGETAAGADSPAASLDLSTATIVTFYETLYAHRNLGRKSRYRKKDYMYVQVDGRPQAMPVSPITAFETPLVLGGACDSLSEAFQAEAASPLILNATFTVDFLCIRPFDEGNGRISRLFSLLMLEKAGFDIARYASVDRVMEESGMDYYNALNNCVEGWDRSANDYEAYALYWLDVLHKAYQRLFDELDARAAGPGGKTARVRAFVQRAASPVSKRQILAACPDISEATVENALGKMVKDGEARKVGAGRSTAYEWVE